MQQEQTIQNDQQNQHFGTAEPELEFSENTNAEVVDSDYHNQKQRDINCWCISWTIVSSVLEPVADDEDGCDEVVWCCDYVLRRFFSN